VSVVVHPHGPTPERVAAAFRRACEQKMREAMLEVEGEVRSRAPFRTGHLRRSLTSVVRVHGDQIVGTVGTTTRYAPWLEMGTGLYGPRNRPIVPVRARALRFPAGGSASTFAGGRRRQGRAGPGFRLSGQQRAGRAGANAEYVFRRSVRGIHPLHFFRDSMLVSQGRVHRRLGEVPGLARRLLEGRA
jgi:Bacteriophage HK97-gp10, putative tail-component